jgi:hypothetical protein
MFDSNWINLKEKIKLTYPIITEEDLELNDGEELVDLLARLQEKFIKNKDDIITMMNKP